MLFVRYYCVFICSRCCLGYLFKLFFYFTFILFTLFPLLFTLSSFFKLPLVRVTLALIADSYYFVPLPSVALKGSYSTTKADATSLALSAFPQPGPPMVPPAYTFSQSSPIFTMSFKFRCTISF